MPSYSETWDITKPAGSRDLSLGDDDIREFKRAIDERLNEDHVKPNDETGYTTVGYHRKCTLIKLGSNPTAVTDTLILFCKNDGSTDELFIIDESGNVIQLTDAGKLAVLGSEGFRSGDKLLSSNTSTPSGWIDQSATYTDNFIRISSGTPLTTGGSDTHTHSAGSFASAPHTHGYTVPYTGYASVNSSAGAGGLTSSASSSNDYKVSADRSLTTSADSGAAITGVSASANNVPVYVQMKMYSKT